MSVTITLSPESEAWLAKRASAMRQDLPTYIAAFLDRLATSSQALPGLLQITQEAFDASGMTDDELGDLLEDAKHAMRAERRNAVGHHG